jgi:hypothetical protein
MEKKHTSKNNLPSQLDLFQQSFTKDELKNGAVTFTYSNPADYSTGATVIQMTDYKTRQQVDKFYEVIKTLTSHLD